jgi:hypothetical protein
VAESSSSPPGRDLSAGRWRDLFYAADATLPPVQPQHERRKFLRGSRILKYAGLGKYGCAHLDRAATLWRAGFTSRPVRLEDGFLESDFVPGRPCTAADVTGLLGRLRAYLHALRVFFPSRRELPLDEIQEMVRVNVAESLGPEWSERAGAQLQRRRSAAEDGQTVDIDGRMLPHEWIETRDGFLKVDALDHHDDHFFPGAQDIYWDMAATTVEFELHPESMNYLTDNGSISKLQFYLIGYLSYRIGYCAMAAGALTNSCEGERFRRLVTYYGSRLRREVAGG